MSTKSPFSVDRYLRAGQGTGIGKLLDRAALLRELTTRVRRHLPAELAQRCEVVGLRDKHLILLTHSPVWAARLRFAAADLGKQLASEGIRGIRRTEVRVTPAATPGKPDRRRHAVRLSNENARLIRQTASGIRDRKLADALCRLAKKTGRD